MPPLPASIGPFAPLHRGMIKCSGSYVFTPDGAMRAWQTWVSANRRLIRSARGPANLRIGGLCWFRQCLGLDSLRLRGRGIGSANHVCNVAEPVLRVQLSRSPLAAQSYRLWIFPSVSAATTIINDELSIGSVAVASRKIFNPTFDSLAGAWFGHVRGPKGGDVQIDGARLERWLHLVTTRY